jgi:hypothetical protein
VERGGGQPAAGWQDCGWKLVVGHRLILLLIK